MPFLLEGHKKGFGLLKIFKASFYIVFAIFSKIKKKKKNRISLAANHRQCTVQTKICQIRFIPYEI